MGYYETFCFLKELKLVYNISLKLAPFRKKLRILKFIIRKYLLKNNIPLAVIIGVTYKCQCNCLHCSVDNYRRDNNYLSELSTKEIKACIDEIFSLGCIKVNFFGGEPLLREDIVELISYASKKDLFIFMDTNAFLLDRSMAKRLKNAGLTCAIISFDSVDKRKHDEIRNLEGLYEKAINGLIYCIEEGIPCVISTIATPDSINLGDLERLIRFAKNIGVTAVRILLPMLSGKWNSKIEYMLTKTEESKVWEYLEPGFVYLESGFSYKKGKVSRRICQAAVKGLIYISPYGDVQMCYTVPHSFGNIKEKPLEEIVKLMWNDRLFKLAPRTECMMNNFNYRRLFTNKYSTG